MATIEQRLLALEHRKKANHYDEVSPEKTAVIKAVVLAFLAGDNLDCFDQEVVQMVREVDASY